MQRAVSRATLVVTDPQVDFLSQDATAAAMIPDGDGYLAALTNFRFMANAVWTTKEACQMSKAAG